MKFKTVNHLTPIQQQVDSWINSIGIRYFSELTNLSNLIEETGEVARLIGREYGEQSFKKGEKPECIKTEISDELSDVLFILICLSNQLGINLDDSFIKNMDKKTKRDTKRHELNKGSFCADHKHLILRNNNANHFTHIQQQVDAWIEEIGKGYFNELTNLSNLSEEVGEVARLIGRAYGEQSFKKDEEPECIKTAIADELVDVLFIVVCLANQLDINLDDAFAKNMDKKTKRDITRHKNNSKLN
ncbi:nucleotide pyrophosphohydrolase [Colwellia sp. BRX8-9]|uniref:nucleotide pyrophosphohydrolase n=1 Tax=Colwellia sp. BRX8-9 TaxID=2759831 RepID=UPI001C715DDB|nr:nucleotide pyrophosphohydrolase [Colwellia sp. BRX8-9]